MNKKILILSVYYYQSSNPGSNRMHSFAKEFVLSGYDVDIISLFERDIDIYEYGARIIAFGTKWAEDKTPKGRLLRGLFLAKKAKSWLRKNKKTYDWVILTDPDSIPCYFFSGFCIRRNWKIIYDVRDVWPEVAIEMGNMKTNSPIALAFRFITKSLYKKATLILTVSQGKVLTLTKKSPKTSHKIRIVPNGFDDDLLKPFSNEITEKIKEKIPLFPSNNIIYAGNVGKAQGLDSLLFIAKSQMSKKNMHFFIIGDGSDKKRLVDEAEKMSLTNVFFCDPIPKEWMPALYLQANAIVVSLKNDSMKDSIPSKLYEVLALGMPTFLLASGDSVSLLAETKMGVAVNPNASMEEICKAFIQFYSKIEAFQSQRSFCKTIMENYSRAKIAKHLIEMIQSEV